MPLPEEEPLLPPVLPELPAPLEEPVDPLLSLPLLEGGLLEPELPPNSPLAPPLLPAPLDEPMLSEPMLSLEDGDELLEPVLPLPEAPAL